MNSVATIAAGAAISNAIYLDDRVAVGLIMPDTWTSARVSFVVSADGVNYFPLYIDTESVCITNPSVSTAYTLDMSLMVPWQWIKIVSGTHATHVNQSSGRTLTIVSRQS